MSNKKLSRLLEPNLKFYFAVMLLFAVAAIPVNWQLALAEGTLTVLLYFYFRQSNQKRRQGVLQYIDSVTGSVDTASKSTLINSPLPAGYRGDHLEQRELFAAGRRPGASL